MPIRSARERLQGPGTENCRHLCEVLYMYIYIYLSLSLFLSPGLWCRELSLSLSKYKYMLPPRRPSRIYRFRVFESRMRNSGYSITYSVLYKFLAKKASIWSGISQILDSAFPSYTPLSFPTRHAFAYDFFSCCKRMQTCMYVLCAYPSRFLHAAVWALKVTRNRRAEMCHLI